MVCTCLLVNYIDFEEKATVNDNREVYEHFSIFRRSEIVHQLILLLARDLCAPMHVSRN